MQFFAFVKPVNANSIKSSDLIVLFYLHPGSRDEQFTLPQKPAEAKQQTGDVGANTHCSSVVHLTEELEL
ncbi:hypothetical protein ILYODFUR_002545 [Ilyodon furcidens]|uniref:Uncharacterized protein n=1 Tax=Ilyodon furcidens TaxID=33524 RepID=A0ABV0U247_9TELE